MERYLFFNSTFEDEREYNAQDFADYFGSLITNGIIQDGPFDGGLAVLNSGSFLSATVGSGQAIINGHLYINTTDLNVDFSLPTSSTMIRYDAVMVRLNYVDRIINSLVVKGVEKPTDAEARDSAPTVIRNSETYDLMLALVKVTTSGITINDTRLNDDICGLAGGLLKIPTQDLQAAKEQFYEEWNDWFNSVQGETFATKEQLDEHVDNALLHNHSGIATGTNDLVMNIGTLTTSGNGVQIVFKNTTTNTGNVTLSVNGGAAKPILKSNGSQLAAGYLKAGGVYSVFDDGANFILLGEGGEYGDVTADKVLSGVNFGTEEGLKVGTMPNRGAVTNTLNAGGSYTIPEGYHNGSGRINAATLAAQTQANATAAQILSGQTAWVNGALVTGTMANRGTPARQVPGTTDRTLSAGYYPTGITIAGDANLIAANIPAGKTMFGIAGTAALMNPTAGANLAMVIPNLDYYNDSSTTMRILTETATMNYAGSIRIIFDGYLAYEDTMDVWYQVYKNGVPAGTLHMINKSILGSGYKKTFSQDFTCAVGDKFAIYGKSEYSSSTDEFAPYVGACGIYTANKGLATMS